ncbi:MAG: zinc ribbon domain-containing protein [Terrimicrobiaceae bacterium]|nr:zinc ribbon domain-containing protein [Terrimicrobiaceae bacterium]
MNTSSKSYLRRYVFHCVSCGWGFRPSASQSRFCPRCGQKVQRPVSMRTKARTVRNRSPRPHQIHAAQESGILLELMPWAISPVSLQAKGALPTLYLAAKNHPILVGCGLVAGGAALSMMAQVAGTIALWLAFFGFISMFISFSGSSPSSSRRSRQHSSGITEFPGRCLTFGFILTLGAVVAAFVAKVAVLVGFALITGKAASLAYQNRHLMLEAGRWVGSRFHALAGRREQIPAE